MNASTKAITITSILLAATLLFSSPVQARQRRRQARHAPARNRGGNRDGGSRSGLSLSVDLTRLLFANASTTTRQWVPGQYQTHTEQVLVEPAHYELRQQRVLVEPAHYEIQTLPAIEKIRRGSRRNPQRFVIKPARTRKVWVPDRYEMRTVKVYVPDRYETRQSRVWVPGHWVHQPARSSARPLLNLGAVFNFRF